MELRRKKKRSVLINLTSLIDVLFLLLIFFMISTTFLSQPVISLELPDAENSESVRQKPVVLHVDQYGSVYLNDEPMELPLLEQALLNQMEMSDEKSCVLKADSRVSHGTVIRILDIIKGAGVTNIQFATNPDED